MTDLELYNKAKEAYYNGSPIMTDYDFDELEKKLGLENKSYIGSKHSPAYTIQHPFIMGSLAKVQVKINKDNTVNWAEYFSQVNSYIKKANTDSVIVTPKYDGCSWEAVINDGKVVSISSRGDGEWGKDLSKHIGSKVSVNVKKINKQLKVDYVIRGEVLIDKFVFETKYADFVNPRSFVSGLLNRDFDKNDTEMVAMLDDLSIVIYEIRYNKDGQWIDVDWFNYKYADCPKYFYTINLDTVDKFEYLYSAFEKYRNEDCQFALDGIVFKPVGNHRFNNLTEHRPKDCVAVKFAPMLQETEIVRIDWQLSKKTGEYCPVIIVNPVIMDGKSITKASAHNYGYVIDKKISIGTKVVLSLAGDIIPFIYEVTDTSAFDVTKIGIDISDCDIDGVHLYKKLTDEEKTKNKFIASAQTLGIPSIGPAAAEKIFEFVKGECQGDEFFDIPAKDVPDNILLVNAVDINRALGGKLGENASKAFTEYLAKMGIKDIITSCTFPLCGVKVSEQIEAYMIDNDSADWASLPKAAYEWVFNTESSEYVKVNNIMNIVGKTVDQQRKVVLAKKANTAEQIPVILTGEPNDYASKGDFINKHPEYRMTGSWKEVKIVFTNSMDSNTGKMKKAREKGIEIRLY